MKRTSPGGHKILRTDRQRKNTDTTTTNNISTTQNSMLLRPLQPTNVVHMPLHKDSKTHFRTLVAYTETGVHGSNHQQINVRTLLPATRTRNWQRPSLSTTNKRLLLITSQHHRTINNQPTCYLTTDRTQSQTNNDKQLRRAQILWCGRPERVRDELSQNDSWSNIQTHCSI